VTEPIGLSTSWNGPGAGSASVLDQHRELGFRRLEAYAHFTPDQLVSLAEAARARDMQIASLHAPCPVPVTELGQRARYGDWLASTQPGERAAAVDAHRRSIDAAAEIGARAVVIHLGTTGVPSRQASVFDVVARTGRDSDEHRRVRDEALAARQAAAGPHVEAALSSIRVLGEHAAGTGVMLGVETRDGYQEIPSLDEFSLVFAACEGLPVGYWHDAGHGAKLAYAGFVRTHSDYLDRCGERLVGMHIHDTRGPRDHRAPGQGDTDFGMLAGYLKESTIRTLELHPSVTASEITHALDVLSDLPAFGVREGILVEL
jgi:sugar phosphate isomerase/epimerase